MNERLDAFIAHAQEKGMELTMLRQVLLSAGWKDKEIVDAICARELEMPIPKPTGDMTVRAQSKSRSSVPRKARDAFLHLLTYAALYASTSSVILLLFTYLDFAFPDPAWRTSYNQLQMLLSVMRVQLAVIVVAFPVFLFAWTYLLREVQRNPHTGKGLLRRWLGNLSLCVGVILLATNAMTLVYFLLEGQLTIRFILKTAVLFLIAGGLVSYLAMSLRSEAKGVAEGASC